MLIEAGILLSAYVGKRLLEKRCQKLLTLNKKNLATQKGTKPLQSYFSQKATHSLNQQQGKTFERRFKVSLLSFGVRSSKRSFVGNLKKSFFARLRKITINI